MQKHNQRICISNLTARERGIIIDTANFTDEQRAVFDKLNDDKYYDYAIMQMLNMSSRRYYAVKCVVVDKAERIAEEHGFKSALYRHLRCN